MHSKILIILILSLLGAGTGNSKAEARDLTLRRPQGTTNIFSNTGSRRPSRTGTKLYEGYRIQTGSYNTRTRQQSKAGLIFDFNQGTALVGPRSDIRVSRLRRFRGGAITHFYVWRGSMWATLRRFTNPYSEVILNYRNGARQVIRGTEFGIDFDDVDNEGIIITKSGAVAVFDDETSTAIGPNEGVVLRSDGKVSLPKAAYNELSYTGLSVVRGSGGQLDIIARVVVKHCISVTPTEARCVEEPTAYPLVTILGKTFQGNQDGIFRVRANISNRRQWLDILISHEGQQNIIKLDCFIKPTQI